MKTSFRPLIIGGIMILILTGCSTLRKTSFKTQTKEILEKVLDWQIENFTYQESGNLHDHGIDAWTNGVFYIGALEFTEIAEKKEHYIQWFYNQIGKKNSWKIPSNFANYKKYSLYHADELCIGQFYAMMYRKHGDEKIIQSLQERLDWIIEHQGDTSMNYRNKQTWSWCDALFMAPPVYAQMTNITGKKTYLNYLNTQFKATYNHLYDKEEQLFFRDDSYFQKREANGQKIFWGRGNGWVVAGLARLLTELPKDDLQRDFYIDTYKSIINRLISLRDTNGFWHASLLDQQSYPAPETSATSMITYAIAWGVNNGILDSKEFSSMALTSWNALMGMVDENGRLGYVQPIGADPKKVTSEMTASYGVGAFLMAGTEIYKMLNK